VTSYRDLADADAFHRRRLVTAFMSGGRPGNDAAPRASRCLLGGLVLAAVLTAGTAMSGAVTGHPNLTWSHGEVRISR
jgi:hypothetical protein